jgi:hypothetical protein
MVGIELPIRDDIIARSHITCPRRKIFGWNTKIGLVSAKGTTLTSCKITQKTPNPPFNVKPAYQKPATFFHIENKSAQHTMSSTQSVQCFGKKKTATAVAQIKVRGASLGRGRKRKHKE